MVKSILFSPCGRAEVAEFDSSMSCILDSGFPPPVLPPGRDFVLLKNGALGGFT